MAKGQDGNKGNQRGGKPPEEKHPAEKHPEKYEDKKHSEVKPSHSAPIARSKGHSPLPDGCFSWGCKAEATRFNFCSEHFDQFKFGLIKKTGEPVSDYEKKFEHYKAHQAKKGVQLVA